MSMLDVYMINLDFCYSRFGGKLITSCCAVRFVKPCHTRIISTGKCELTHKCTESPCEGQPEVLGVFQPEYKWIIYLMASEFRSKHTHKFIQCFLIAMSHGIRHLGVGIALWLGHWTGDWQIVSSSPSRSSKRLSFPRVSFLCWLLFWYPCYCSST